MQKYFLEYKLQQLEYFGNHKNMVGIGRKTIFVVPK
jgi:hypothetical protein